VIAPYTRQRRFAIVIARRFEPDCVAASLLANTWIVRLLLVWGDMSALILAAFLMGSSDRPEPRRSITVHYRYPEAVCAGFCTDEDLSIQDDGRVEYRVRPIGSRWKVFRYKVSPEQVRQFWSAFALSRPVRVKRPAHCDGLIPTVDYNFAYDVLWSDTSHSRLLACAGDPFRSVYFSGLRILQISPATGARLTEEEGRSLN